jgi:hypothetical protein
VETQITEAPKPQKRPKAASSSKPKDKYSLKKISIETAKAIQVIKDKANKKPFGRKVKDAEVLAMAVSMISDAEIKILQEATYSEQDRLKMAHSDYVQKNGKISFDDFIGKLLRGEVQNSN